MSGSSPEDRHHEAIRRDFKGVRVRLEAVETTLGVLVELVAGMSAARRGAARPAPPEPERFDSVTLAEAEAEMPPPRAVFEQEQEPAPVQGAPAIARPLQDRLLARLREAGPTGLTIRTIAEAFGCSAANVRSSLQRLQARGLVARRGGAGRGSRSQRWYLTDQAPPETDRAPETGRAKRAAAKAPQKTPPPADPMADPDLRAQYEAAKAEGRITQCPPVGQGIGTLPHAQPTSWLHSSGPSRSSARERAQRGGAARGALGKRRIPT